MKLYNKHQQRRGFNLFEVLVVVAVVAVLLTLLLPVLSRQHRHLSMSWCGRHLEEIGIAVRIWEGDNDDKYPMAVPAALGGAQEMMATGNVVSCFQVMSNEMSSTRVLICTEDAWHQADTNWSRELAWVHLSRTNISYFMGLDAVESDPRAVLAGDANLVQHGRVVPSGIVNLATNITTWTPDRHGRTGNILLADGSVRFESVTEISSSAAPGAYASTNRVVVP